MLGFYAERLTQPIFEDIQQEGIQILDLENPQQDFQTILLLDIHNTTDLMQSIQQQYPNTKKILITDKPLEKEYSDWIIYTIPIISLHAIQQLIKGK